MGNGHLLPGTQVLESSITSSCTIIYSYRLHPISALLSIQGSVFWLVVQCGVPMYVRLGGKGYIAFLYMALEISVASKLGTPRYFAPKPHAIGSHNLWLIISMVLLKNSIGEPWNPAQLPKQPPSLDGS